MSNDKMFEANFKGADDILSVLNSAKESLKDLSPLMKLARVLLKSNINENFNTSGEHTGEKWKEWSDKYKLWRMKNGKSGNRILSLEGNLQKHISAKSGADFAKVYTHEKYAAIHNFGFHGKNKRGAKMNMPQREFMRLDEAALNDLYAELYIEWKDMLWQKEIHRKVYGDA